VKAWLLDAVVLGVLWTLFYALFGHEHLAWAALGGAGFGITMASLAAWRRWPTFGRRLFSPTQITPPRLSWRSTLILGAIVFPLVGVVALLEGWLWWAGVAVVFLIMIVGMYALSARDASRASNQRERTRPSSGRSVAG
jgi:hypothetical protein